MKFAFCQLTFILIGFSLLIDSINGFFLAGVGIDTKLSIVYKFTLLALVIFQIGSYSRRSLITILSAILLLMIGPTITLYYSLDITAIIKDLSFVFKILTPLIIFVFCVYVSKRWPDLVQKYGKWCCQLCFVVLTSNLLLGLMGYGFSSYGGNGQKGSASIGIKGFFFAGNEVSGLFILLFGIILHLIWQRNKFLYLIFIPITLFCGLLIATKAAILSSAILIIAIPVFSERNRLFNITWLKLKLIIPILILITLLGFFIIPIFESAGVWSRFVWFYEHNGLLGMLLSGRIEFVENAVRELHQTSSICQYFFGVGFSGLSAITKGSMEIDLIDIYFWFGLIGLVTFLVQAVIFFRVSYLSSRHKDSFWGSGVLLINIILYGVSFIAGHILTSGMLAPFLGLINGMAYADLQMKNHINKDADLEFSHDDFQK